MYGVDTVDIDEETLLMGFFRRSKKFFNIKNIRQLKDKTSSYQDKSVQNKSLFLVYIGVQKEGLSYTRIEYGIMDMISKSGGFLVSMKNFYWFIVMLVCGISSNA